MDQEIELVRRRAGLSASKKALLEERLRSSLQKSKQTQLSIPLRTPTQALILSSAQQRLWFLDQLAPNNPFYNIPLVISLNGVLNVAVLKRCLHELICRHEILRTNFLLQQDEPVQIINFPSVLPLPVIDISHPDEVQVQMIMECLQQSEAARPFSLSHEPLLRCTLLRLQPQKHVLLMTMHHVITDGWSMGILQRELVALYAAFSQQNASPLPPLPLQYADYALWQRTSLQSEKLHRQLTYWKQQLADLVHLELPTDHPRSSQQNFVGAFLAFTLPDTLAKSLHTLCKQEGITLFVALLAAFNMLLMRYSGQDDIAVGTPISGRTRTELEDLVGFFVNTLVIRTRLPGNPRLREVIEQVRRSVSDAFNHQEVPFERLVEELQPDRDNSRYAPLIQTLFTLKVPIEATFSLPQLQLQASEREIESTQFDMMLTMSEEQGRISGVFHYNTDLFDATTIARMMTHWQNILESIVTNPDEQIASLPLLSPGEHYQLLIQWNATRIDYQEPLIHQCFEMQVERTPTATALIFEDTSLTYAELNQHANQLAHYLQRLGVGPDVLVGICMERSLGLLIGLLGILKAGGAYVPLDPTYPQDRLRSMLEDSQACVLLTQRQWLKQITTPQVTCLCLDEIGPQLAQESLSCPGVQLHDEHLAYMIYTSGSTGKPKGAMNTQRGMRNRLLWMQNTYRLTEADVVLQKTPFSFDVSVWEFFWPLITGARLVIARPGGHQDSGYLADIIQEQQINTVHFVPPMLSVFLQEPAVDQCRSLRQVICSGEALSLELQERFFARLPAARLHNLYGPTEASIDVTFWQCERDNYQGATVPIGRPIANTHIYLLDRYWQPVPIGTPAELFIGGIGLARGYLNRADLTAECFIPDPFSQEPGARLYRTGDLARYLANGAIEYLGRLDYQVKVRGFRIELGEIEATITHYPDVHQTVVLARDDLPGGKRLVAYVVPTRQTALSTALLRQYLQDRLPDYMVPSLFVLLDALPLTTNGKVDRKALPTPEISADEYVDSRSAPYTPLQELIIGVWRDVLGHAQIGLHDNFFALGGHSLLATQVLTRLRTMLRIEIPLKSLFESLTVAGMAELIERSLRGTQDARCTIVPVARNRSLPLSFAQQRLWFLDQLEQQTATYIVPLVVRLEGQLDVFILRRCLQEIVQRHEILRTVFIAHEGKPMQVIRPSEPIPFPVVDLMEVEEKQDIIFRLADDESGRPFDLSRDFLLRGELLRIERQEHILILVLHHIIVDAWSLGVIVQELAALYEAFLSEKASPLTTLPVQYADYAVWQHQWLQDEWMDSLLEYWRARLEGATPLMLPTDRALLPTTRSRGARYTFTLPPELTRQLIVLSRQEQVTLFMTLLAAFQTLLYRHTGQTDSVMGTDIAGRTRQELEGMIGFFVNLLILRTDLSGGPSFRELLRRVAPMVLDAYAHQELPFEKLVEELELERTYTQTPLVRALFVFQNTPMPPLVLPGITLSPMEIAPRVAKFDLATFLWEGEQGLIGMVDYRTDLFEAQTIERLIARFTVLLGAIVEQPDATLESYPIFIEEELRQRVQKDQRDYEENRRKIKIARRHEISVAPEK